MIASLSEVHVSEWSLATGAHIGMNFQKELSEGGVRALTRDIPNVSRDQLQAVPLDQWQRDKDDFTWESWVERASAAAK
jgi:hypothetical protein